MDSGKLNFRISLLLLVPSSTFHTYMCAAKHNFIAGHYKDSLEAVGVANRVFQETHSTPGQTQQLAGWGAT